MTRFFVASMLGVAGSLTGAETDLLDRHFTFPDDYTLSVAAPPSLIARPMEACFDDKGRLYVTESSGSNEKVEEQLAKKPHRLLRLTDSNDDGVFDSKTVFADQLMFPEGVLWHENHVYVAAPPQIWKLTDADDDGVAERREVWFDGKTLTGCANDLHGPYLGPEGLIYWCKGAFAEQTHDLLGKPQWKSRASHVFRAKPDGSQMECVFTAGMDNPVGLAWTPEGDLIVSGTFFQHPGDGKRDGLIHAVRGGVWGKDHDALHGHWRTGPLMPPMTHLGPAAPCGICRYGEDFLVCQFNLRKVSRHKLAVSGATFQTQDEDFLVSTHPDFHPTDVLQCADGSVLVIDTGGWYKLCCPTSQIARPEVPGAIYRLRRKGGEVPTTTPEPRWKLEKPHEAASLIAQAKSSHPHVRRMAVEALGVSAFSNAGERSQATTAIVACLEQAAEDRFLEHAAIFAMLELFTLEEVTPLVKHASPKVRAGALYVLAQKFPQGLASISMTEMLVTGDATERQAIEFALGHVSAWRQAALDALRQRLESGQGLAELKESVVIAARDEEFRRELGRFCKSATDGSVRRALLEIMLEAARQHGREASWSEPLLAALERDGEEELLAARILATGKPNFDEPIRKKLAKICQDEKRRPAVRLALLAARGELSATDAEAKFLLSSVQGSDPTQALSAARILATARFSTTQLADAVRACRQWQVLVRPEAIKVFRRCTDESIGLALAEEMSQGNWHATLPESTWKEVLGGFPPSVQDKFSALRADRATGDAAAAQWLAATEKSLPAGDERRGSVVFQSAKAACATCHQAGYLGKNFGPDLSKIGGIRTRSDLLEAIAFPSASLVRSYETVELKKHDGAVLLGIVRSQTDAETVLAIAAGVPDLRIPNAEIASLTPGTVSLMPAGYAQSLSLQELADLLAFLTSLK